MHFVIKFSCTGNNGNNVVFNNIVYTSPMYANSVHSCY